MDLVRVLNAGGGWELERMDSAQDCPVWRIQPAKSPAKPEKWALLQRRDGQWVLLEVMYAVSTVPQAPWDRLRALADQLEREAKGA
jgi:hypothetical protein